MKEDVRRFLGTQVKRYDGLLERVRTGLKDLYIADKIGNYKAAVELKEGEEDLSRDSISGINLNNKVKKVEEVQSDLAKLEEALVDIRQFYLLYLEVERDEQEAGPA